MKKDTVTDYLHKLRGDLYRLTLQTEHILKLAEIVGVSRRVFICGNGGSAAIASHMVNDLIKMCGLDAMCLSDSIPLMTAYANDKSYSDCFSEQLKVLGNKDDALVVISGSGDSNNILYAVAQARSMGMKTVAIVGTDGGAVMTSGVDEVVHVNTDMLHSEDCFMILNHVLATLLKKG